MTLREVLHAHIPTLNAESSLRDAVDKMDVYQFPALVVVDQDLRPTHVVTEGDVCRAVQRKGSVTRLSTERVTTFATPDPVTAGPDAEVSDSLYTMLNSGLTVLPVVQEDRLMGVVLRVDLMQAILLGV